MGTINRQIIVNKFSTPEEGVSVREQDYKDPKPNELIIRTGYCPINPADLNVSVGKLFSSFLSGISEPYLKSI